MITTDILLIEDSPSQALQTRLLLERAGYTVQVADDGAAGWRQAYELAPQMILLDVDLPTLDGFQVLARLKRDRATADIPVVMLTYRQHISHVERAITLGAADYFFKDDPIHQLYVVIKQQLYPSSLIDD
jgi:DNA-binding response OmpR family regulator